MPPNDERISTHAPTPMMSVQPRSHDDLFDIILAHQYRLSLKKPPRQSFFRVVAVVYFSRILDGTRRDNERHHVVGTNDEPHSIAGSICAERAALMQLRFIPDLDEITKIVIVTDSVDAISPGMLCREFMASHDRISWGAPIVLGRSVCRKCEFTVSGKECGDSNGCFDSLENYGTMRDVNSSLFAHCSTEQDECRSPHDFLGCKVTLRDLFPYPSVYSRFTSHEAKKFGENFAQRGESKSAKSTMSSSVETTFDFTIQPRESQHVADFGFCGTPRDMDHSTNNALRISCHLTPAHRRKQLMHLASEGIVMESRNKHDIHPIQYGAAVMFNDDTVATATQKTALEYGCTLDAVGQLASIIDKKAIRINEDGTCFRPILLVQCDQFGIAHAPFAQGRAFLTERGYGDCKVLIHQRVKGNESQDCTKFMNGDSAVNTESYGMNLELLEVEANDLAPSPPDISGSLIINNHQ